jgi:predicted nucleic acid-binding protein
MAKGIDYILFVPELLDRSVIMPNVNTSKELHDAAVELARQFNHVVYICEVIAIAQPKPIAIPVDLVFEW